MYFVENLIPIKVYETILDSSKSNNLIKDVNHSIHAFCQWKHGCACVQEKVRYSDEFRSY